MRTKRLNAALVAAIPCLGHAATPLEPVVVTAARTAESMVTTPSSISIIGPEEIQASGAANVAELLAARGGVQVKDLFGNGARASVGMRGLTGGNAAANTLILVDGRPLNNADLGAPNLGSIAVKDIERIEIIQGSAGSLFGDQAVGGVINIITRTPREFSAAAAATAGSYAHREVTARISDSRDNGLSYRVSLQDLASDNYRDHNERDYTDLFSRVDYDYGGGSVFAEYQYLDESLQLPGALTEAQMDADPRQASSTYPDDVNDTRTDVGRLGLRQPLASNWLLEAELTHRDERIDGNAWGSPFDQERRHQGLTPRLIGSFPAAHGTSLLTLGSDLAVIDYRYQAPFMDTDSTQRTQALYAQWVHPTTESIDVTVGGRTARVDNDITDAGAFPGGVTLDDRVSVWELGVSWRASPQWRLFARRDGNFRFAKVDENTFTSPDVDGLDTQTGVSYEMGAEWSGARTRVKLLAYRLELDNEIDFDSTIPGPWGSGANANLDPTRRQGLILEADWTPSRRLGISTEYTYVDPTIEGGSYDGKTIPFVARHTLRLAADYRPLPRWRLFAEALYTGERYQDADYGNSLDKLPAITTANLNLAYEQGPWHGELRVNNLTDEEYAGYATYDAYYPAPERHWRLTLGYRL